MKNYTFLKTIRARFSAAVGTSCRFLGFPACAGQSMGTELKMQSSKNSKAPHPSKKTYNFSKKITPD
jgi:hypothetical protein